MGLQQEEDLWVAEVHSSYLCSDVLGLQDVKQTALLSAEGRAGPNILNNREVDFRSTQGRAL